MALEPFGWLLAFEKAKAGWKVQPNRPLSLHHVRHVRKVVSCKMLLRYKISISALQLDNMYQPQH
jgi:hypothetical protein